MKSKIRVYLELMMIPFAIFLLLAIISFVFAETIKSAIGYCLILFLLLSMIALRNLFIIFDSKEENKNEK